MNKGVATGLTVLTAIAAVAIPIGAALVIASRNAEDAEMQRVLGYARDIVARSDATADQIDAGIKALLAAGPRCSAQNVHTMSRIDLASSFIQSIGAIEGNRVTCASTKDVEGVDLGPADIVHDNGVRIRENVSLPFAPRVTFIAVERDGYVAIVHKQLPIDISPDAGDVGLATFARPEFRLLTWRGSIDPAWIRRLGSAHEVAFITDDHIVGVAASRRYQTAAVATVPIERVRDRSRSAATVLVPLGVFAGVVLAVAVLYLARLQLAMPSVIKAALRRGEFFMVYQPVVDLHTGRWVGAEALIRWRRANGEMVRPDIFIAAAEDAGIVGRVTKHMMGLVARDAADLFRMHPDFHLGINLSASDFKAKATVARLARLVEAMNARDGNLMVEVTERSLADPAIASGTIRELRKLGVRIGVDDFGTGYSSLSYLQTFHLDILKIDKSFVESLATDAATSHVIFHIIEMAKSLKLEMIAEGVETEVQAQLLRERGVQFAQGWLFARPMPIAELVLRLEARRRSESHGRT